jgi:metallophosphoesterase superfamily enzyme
VIWDDWWLDHRRMALHRPTGTLVVGDLHLGYLHSRQRLGESVPLESLAEELVGLELGWNELQPSGLLIAGDLVERQATGLIPAFAQWAQERSIQIIGLVPGNHDSKINQAPFPILEQGYRLGRWRISHDDDALPEPLVHGHRHPAIPLPGHGMAACFVVSQSRLMLPAYSAHAAGGSVLRRAIVPWSDGEVIAMAGDRLENLGNINALKAILATGQRKGRRL